jgi:hypothetical protein
MDPLIGVISVTYKIGAAAVELTCDDLGEIEIAASKITFEGLGIPNLLSGRAIAEKEEAKQWKSEELARSLPPQGRRSGSLAR